MLPAASPPASRTVGPHLASWLLALSLCAGAAPVSDAAAGTGPATDRHCDFTPATGTDGPVPGLIVAAEMLLPDGSRPGHAAHIREDGSIGAVAPVDTVRAAHPDAAVLDCRGRAVLSPGFVNPHEHPAYSYAFPDANLNPGYAHRDEWRLGINGKLRLPAPAPIRFTAGDPRSTAILVAMELRHLLGGATAIAGSGGVPGVIRNVNRRKRHGDAALYDAEADVSTFPFSPHVVEDLKDECAGGPAFRFQLAIGASPVFMAYVPHVGEGRRSSCAARAEVARYLERVQRRDRRYAMVHGVATDREDYAVMQASDVTLVWSPRSNLALYGQTVDIAGALEAGVRIALSTDWSPSGSFNMREEINCASRVTKDAGVDPSSETLWRMATSNGAYALGLEDRFGAIGPGLRADLLLVRYAGGNPHEAVLTATDDDILATWIDGEVILLADTLDARLSDRACVTLAGVAPKVCGVLGPAGLTAERFFDDIKAAVPLNDASGQTPCVVPSHSMEGVNVAPEASSRAWLPASIDRRPQVRNDAFSRIPEPSMSADVKAASPFQPQARVAGRSWLTFDLGAAGPKCA